MRFFFLLFFFFNYTLTAQEVSTFFSSSSIDVNDGLIFDAEGNLYGSDFEEGSVYKITPLGDASTFIDGLVSPNGLAFDSNDNLFVADFSNSRIHKYDIDGILLETFIVGANPSGLIKSIENDDMIFTRTSNSSINRLSSDGSISEIVQGSPLNAPVGLAYDDDGQLYAGNFVGRKIYKIFPDSLAYVATIPSSGYLGFITYGEGHIWGTTYDGNKIYKINPVTVDDVTLFAGSSQGNVDGDISVATFSFPNGILFDAQEKEIYISEFGGQGNIRKISNLSGVTSHISEKDKIQLTVNPNPASDVITVSSNFQNKQIIITLSDNLGRTVFKSESLNVDGDLAYQINVSEFRSGIYWLNIVSNNQSYASKAITIVR